MATKPAGDKKKPGWPKAGPGRTKGVPNKVTTEFRQTVTRLLEMNEKKFSRWLDEVAEGCEEKKLPANPAKALDIIASLAEYAAPKISRVEHSGPDGGDIPTSITITHVTPRA